MLEESGKEVGHWKCCIVVKEIWAYDLSSGCQTSIESTSWESQYQVDWRCLMKFWLFRLLYRILIYQSPFENIGYYPSKDIRHPMHSHNLIKDNEEKIIETYLYKKWEIYKIFSLFDIYLLIFLISFSFFFHKLHLERSGYTQDGYRNKCYGKFFKLIAGRFNHYISAIRCII